MTKDALKEFCLLWGFNVEDEWKNMMPYSLFGKMTEDARQKFGTRFMLWINQVTDTTDDFTYLCFDSWEEAFDSWNAFVP